MFESTNTTIDRPTFVTHLECGLTGERCEADVVHGLSKAGRPLLVRYDLERLAGTVDRNELARRPPDMWRYREFLPIRHTRNIVSLGECHTPLIRLAQLESGAGRLVVKDEGRLPTGSFKARGLCLAVSMAKELGITRIAMPTNGNAGAALAAYATRAGIEAFVFCPDDTPEINVREIAAQGARVWRVNGLINDCGRIVGEGRNAMGWFDFSTLKEPYRIEGKKTMGLELADQLSWQLPDVIFYPTGGGTGLIGMWKAFSELQRIGWLRGRLPRMVAVQAAGCAPIVRAFEEGTRHAQLWQNAHTIASGIRVPVAVGDFLILDAVRESNGFATAVDDEAIVSALTEVAGREGLLLCPEGAATFAAWKQELASGRISPDDNCVLFNCATGLKYPLPEASATLDCTRPVDYQRLAVTRHVRTRLMGSGSAACLRRNNSSELSADFMEGRTSNRSVHSDTIRTPSGRTVVSRLRKAGGFFVDRHSGGVRQGAGRCPIRGCCAKLFARSILRCPLRR
ncbi:MAG: threonine synthase [Planctomycetaceae bacterium]